MALVGNASDPGQVKEAGRQELNKQKQFELDLQHVLSSKAGRNVLWGYLSFCGVFASSYAEGNLVYFNEGQRNVGLKMLTDITRVDASAYVKMIQENMEKEDGRE